MTNETRLVTRMITPVDSDPISGYVYSKGSALSYSELDNNFLYLLREVLSLANSKADGSVFASRSYEETVDGNTVTRQFASINVPFEGSFKGFLGVTNDTNTFKVLDGYSEDIQIGWIDGSGIAFRGFAAESPHEGSFSLYARDANNLSKLYGTPSGTLTWNDDALVTASALNQYLKSSGDTLTGLLSTNKINEVFKINSLDIENYADLVAYRKDNNRVGAVRFRSLAASNQIVVGCCDGSNNAPSGLTVTRDLNSGICTVTIPSSPTIEATGNLVATTNYVRAYTAANFVKAVANTGSAKIPVYVNSDGNIVPSSENFDNYLKKAGGDLTGFIRKNGDLVTNTLDTSYLRISAGTPNSNNQGGDNGANIVLWGKLHSSVGRVRIQANNGSNKTELNIYPDKASTFSRGLSISGNLDAINGSFYSKHDTKIGAKPTGGTYRGFYVQDADNKRMASLESANYENGNIALSFFVARLDGSGGQDAFLRGIRKPDGTLYTETVTPPTTATGREIATAAFVNNRLKDKMGFTCAGPVVLSSTTDAAGTSNTSPALRIGNIAGAHLAIDNNEIIAKASGTAVSSLLLNSDGGAVTLGSTTLGVTADNSSAFRARTSKKLSLGSSSYLWTTVFASTGSINTSDERAKQEIRNIPDDVLDAWSEVQWQQFKFNDSVAEKGKNSARIHFGLIAQRLNKPFSDRFIDISRYGFFCHDVWSAKEAVYTDSGKLLEPAIPVGDAYALRYEEALCLEAAYQRRRADRLEARIRKLEQAILGG